MGDTYSRGLVRNGDISQLPTHHPFNPFAVGSQGGQHYDYGTPATTRRARRAGVNGTNVRQSMTTLPGVFGSTCTRVDQRRAT